MVLASEHGRGRPDTVCHFDVSLRKHPKLRYAEVRSAASGVRDGSMVSRRRHGLHADLAPALLVLRRHRVCQPVLQECPPTARAGAVGLCDQHDDALLHQLGHPVVLLFSTPWYRDHNVRRNPMRWVFQQLFHFRERFAAAIALPSLYATASGFTYCYSRQFKAMGKSGLINPWFAKSQPGHKTPVNALVVGSIVSYAMCVVVNYVPYLGRNQLFNISMLCAISAYASHFVSFAVFRYKFSTIKREFISPLGLAGAVYGILVFFLTFLGICAFQTDHLATIVYAVYVLLVIGYYFYAAQERQCFSAEEKTVMFRAYLMKSKELLSLC